MIRMLPLVVLLGVLAACGGGSASEPTPEPKVYVLTTALAVDSLRQVASAYEQGEDETAQEICTERRNDLYLEAIGEQFSDNEGPMLDHDAFVEICESAAAEGWSAVRTSALAAID